MCRFEFVPVCPYSHPLRISIQLLVSVRVSVKNGVPISLTKFQYNCLCRSEEGKSRRESNLYPISIQLLVSVRVLDAMPYFMRFDDFNTTACVGSSFVTVFVASSIANFNTTACVGSSYQRVRPRYCIGISIQLLVSVRVDPRNGAKTIAEKFQYNCLCRFEME